MLFVAGETTAQDAFDTRSGQPTLASDEERGRSQPSEEVELMFPQPGLISQVAVKDGQPIKKGEVLALQDDAVEQAALAREEFLLKSTVQLQAAEANRDLAEVEMKRQTKMRKDGSGSVTEFEKAKVELIIAKLKIDLANEETEAKRLDVAKLKAQLNRMRIVSPFDGPACMGRRRESTAAATGGC